MQTPVLTLGGQVFTLVDLALAGAGVVIVVLLLALLKARAGGQGLDRRLADLTRAQAEAAGRMQTLAEVLGSRQSELATHVGERLDGFGRRLGLTLADTTRATREDLARLQERLAVIDRAQRGIGELAGRVVELQSILSNKQARGAFGQGRMEAIVADALPFGGYAFQATLSNGTRPDCTVTMPNGAGALVIDAKFPLESWTAWREAPDEARRREAARGVRRDVGRHVGDIAGKYLLPGETQDTAFLFVPSEAIFADLHEQFDDVVQQAHRARVVIVSPSLLALAIQVVQSVLRDARLREAADRVRSEVGLLLDDVTRLAERAQRLQSHFGQTTRDLDQMAISLDKVTRRAERIEALDLGSSEGTDAPSPLAPTRLAGE